MVLSLRGAYWSGAGIGEKYGRLDFLLLLWSARKASQEVTDCP
jgi:hypothetical protein